MGSYVLNFAVYTLAMSGLIFFALFVYKKVMSGNFGINTSKDLSIEETLSINPRKSLLIVRAGDERFLLASDVDKTTLISKLNSKETVTDVASEEIADVTQSHEKVSKISDLKINKEKKQTIPMKDISKLLLNDKIHLDVIYGKNPKKTPTRRSRKREQALSTKGSSISNTNKVENIGSSPIKQIARKINEL